MAQFAGRSRNDPQLLQLTEKKENIADEEWDSQFEHEADFQNEITFTPLEMIKPGIYARTLENSEVPLIVSNHAFVQDPSKAVANSVCDGTTAKRLEKAITAFSKTKLVDEMIQAASETDTIAVLRFNLSEGTMRLATDNYEAETIYRQTRYFNEKIFKFQ